jgi:hypothetical protein
MDDASSTAILGAAADTVSFRRSARMEKLYSWLAHQDGQTMADYATVLSVITLLCLAAFTLFAAASSGAIARVAGLFP